MGRSRVGQILTLEACITTTRAPQAPIKYALESTLSQLSDPSYRLCVGRLCGEISCYLVVGGLGGLLVQLGGGSDSVVHPSQLLPGRSEPSFAGVHHPDHST